MLSNAHMQYGKQGLLQLCTERACPLAGAFLTRSTGGSFWLTREGVAHQHRGDAWRTTPHRCCNMAGPALCTFSVFTRETVAAVEC